LLVAGSISAYAGPAHAGIDLNWNACNLGPNHASTAVASCSNGSVLQLFGAFQLDSAFDSFTDLLASLDLRTTDHLIPSFWNFALTECSTTPVNLTLSTGSECSLPDHTSPWRSSGTVHTAFHYAIDGADPRHAHLELEVHRPANKPTALEAGTNYFAFQLTIPMLRAIESGGQCGGCSAPLAIVWNSASLQGPAEARTITEPGFASTCVTVNGAPATLCGETAAATSTWGAIKALYR
jgi:hypothetical protein